MVCVSTHALHTPVSETTRKGLQTNTELLTFKMLKDTYKYSAHGYSLHACFSMEEMELPVKSLQRNYWHGHPSGQPISLQIWLPRWKYKIQQCGWPGFTTRVSWEGFPGIKSQGGKMEGSGGAEHGSTHSTKRAWRRVAGGTRARAAWLQSSRRSWQRQGSGQGPPGCPGQGTVTRSSSRSGWPGWGGPMAEQGRGSLGNGGTAGPGTGLSTAGSKIRGFGDLL